MGLQPLRVLLAAALLTSLQAVPVGAGRASHQHAGLAKILGGVDARTREFSYMLSMELWGHHICGASALNAWWAVTAAHCVTDVGQEDMVGLRAGSLHRESGGHVYCVVRIMKHPRYGDHWYDHDIALLQVARPLRAGSHVSFLSLPEVADWPPGTRATVIGWGVTRIAHHHPDDSADISFSDRLKKVEVEVVGNEVCRKKPVFFMIYPVTSRMMCAISHGKDSTQGDSGGPLVVQEGNTTVLAGIVSWGEGRGHLDSPGVYTRVSSFTKWIHTHIKRRRPARGAKPLHLLTCGGSTALWSNYSTQKVHTIPARRRRHRQRRARRPASPRPS